jgi:FtsP/CotA-like multicopper oxidase with cupredoxin domain
MHNRTGKYKKPLAAATAAVLLALGAAETHAAVNGISGPTFNLTARADYISAGDGQGIWMWGYANGATMQYPGPTLIVNQGAMVTVNLTNALNDANGIPFTSGGPATSIIFPGQSGVTATVTPAGATACAVDGLLTKEIPAGCADTVAYSFTASQPGTYLYQSGTRTDLQTEMGLFGTLIVRPATANQAYNSADTQYGHEYLFALSEVDVQTHLAVEAGNLNPDMTNRVAEYWFINGRNGTDTILGDGLPWFPTQPYGALAQTHPGDKTLLRVVQAGADLHPFHTHGNNFTQIARDGRLLSTSGTSANLATSDFTLKAIPGETYDALWTWTGKGLGWDIYGYTPSNCPSPYPADKMTQNETDRCKALKVSLPNPGSLTAGQGFSGGPFLGTPGALPPGESTLNIYNGLFFMWHSHTERELTNGDIFPGGMMTFMVVQPPSAPID